MVDIVKMLSHRKGDASTYRPTAGTICLISPPHCDDENGYTYGEFEVLWTDDTFILYRKEGCWPALNKWEHIRSKPLETLLDEATAQPTVAAQQGSIADDALSIAVMAHCNDLTKCAIALRDQGGFDATAAEILKAVEELRAARDSRASSAPVAPIAPDADLAQARRSIAYIRRHVDESKNSHLWVLIDDDIETVSKYLAAPQQEGSEAGK